MPFDDYDDFNQGDQLRLQSLNQGLAQADESLQRDEIDGNDHAELVNQIHAQRAPLVARQKAAFEKGLADQQNMMMRFQAHGQAMEHANNVFEAQNFPDRVGMYTDPMTGNTAHFLKDDKGDWNEIEFKHANQDTGGSEFDDDTAATPYHPLSEMLAGQLPAQMPAPAGATDGATQVNIGGQSFSAPWKGGDKVYDAQGNEVQGGWDAVYGSRGQSGQGLLSEAAMGELWRRANMAVRMQPGRQREAAVARLFDHMVGLHTHAQMAQITQASRTREREAHEQYMEKRQAAAEKAKQEKEARDEEKKLHHEERAETSKSSHQHLARMDRTEREYDKLAAGVTKPEQEAAEALKKRNPWLGDEDLKTAEADRRARAEREKLNPDYYAKYHPKPKEKEGGDNVISRPDPEASAKQAKALDDLMGHLVGQSMGTANAKAKEAAEENARKAEAAKSPERKQLEAEMRASAAKRKSRFGGTMIGRLFGLD